MTEKTRQSNSPDKHSATGKVWVSRTYPKTPAKDYNEDDQLPIRKFEVEPAWVKAGYGLTINLGNYESARCDVGVTLPCYVEEIEEAFKEAWSIADREVQAQVAEIRGR